MSEWLFDLGNSRFKYALLQGDRAGDVQAWPHGAEAMDAAALSALPTGRIAHVASVAAPALTQRMLACLHERFEQVRIVRTAAECAGIRIAYADPSRFGVDRFLALLGARGEAPVLVAGVGTALTIDLLGADGQHHGGRGPRPPAPPTGGLQVRAVLFPGKVGPFARCGCGDEA
ncbi:type III pantothenate kinase, partial [Xanthomonas hortorum]|uniref:type III pantothenate kinase n=1 Tax=Xanthomonas hortorum TaxID=56454 RepID=UPI003F685B12